MPRAEDPNQAELVIRWAENADGLRHESVATSFVVLWHDQFGTRHLALQQPGEDLLGALHEATIEQLLASGYDLEADDFQAGFQNPEEGSP